MFPNASDEKTADIHIVFGSQLLDFDQWHACQLRSALLEDATLTWLLDTLLHLSSDWDTVAKDFLSLRGYAGDEPLAALRYFLRTGQDFRVPFPLPNILLSPLVVAIHVVQYCSLLKLIDPHSPCWDEVQTWLRKHGAVTGLCTGSLTATAVTSHTTWSNTKSACIAAVRVAMLVGALVDAEDAREDGSRRWRSFVVRSTTTDEGALRSILNMHPQAYVSVDHGDGKVTISAPDARAESLQSALCDYRFEVAPISLKGAFHCTVHQQAAEELATCMVSKQATFQDQLILRATAHAILSTKSNWKDELAQNRQDRLHGSSEALALGTGTALAHMIEKTHGCSTVHVTSLVLGFEDLPKSFRKLLYQYQRSASQNLDAHDPIAIVGMACQLPGAEDTTAFWELLCNGSSQHVSLSSPRSHTMDTQRVPGDDNPPFYGNFIEDVRSFDHTFFQNTPSEAAATDPQVRLMLQVAYQAVEQSGYFRITDGEDRRVGCYIGVAVNDYEHNVACHKSSPYTVTGNLTAFAAGKISHFFGWNGPAMAINTACSSSAVAIHEACNAILAGDCVAALAGGANVITTNEWFKSLGAAGFLSSTGQCKPFDAAADGYCRADGVGAILLKKLSAAHIDGNPVFEAVINASASLQNRTSSAVTVPTSSSLEDLYRKVLLKSGLGADDISVVEAHGTGTQVGDAAEYSSLREVFGGPQRTDTLTIGSVKGLIGHAESAAGVLGCIKAIMMLNMSEIPPQISHHTMNPRFHAIETDNMQIPLRLLPWKTPHKAVLVNSYGASGSITSILFSRPDHPNDHPNLTEQRGQNLSQYPFLMCAATAQSLQAYCRRLQRWLGGLNHTNDSVKLSQISLQLTRQCNRSLGHRAAFACSSMRELDIKLLEVADGADYTSSRPSRPVILCFGGQTAAHATLDRVIYDNSPALRTHLDRCHRTAVSLGYQGVLPEIFERQDGEDIVLLHTMLFALQYSSARAWMTCRVPVAAVIGHSFGELTALCISGVVSLSDALRMVVGRAKVIQFGWQGDRGAMMAVEAPIEQVQRLLFTMTERHPREARPTIACFNGPTSFTLSGTTTAIRCLSDLVCQEPAASHIKAKMLDVTHAFHSDLTKHLLPELRTVCRDVIWRRPSIHLERCTITSEPVRSPERFCADHMESPVHFVDAVRRLSQLFPRSIWLEAGSRSGVTAMAMRTVGDGGQSYFQPIDISSQTTTCSIAHSTAELWREGVDCEFLGHSTSSHQGASLLMLPPYQFTKNEHWLPLLSTHKVPVETSAGLSKPLLWTTLGVPDTRNGRASFRILTSLPLFHKLLKSHVLFTEAPVCPMPLQFEIVAGMLRSLAGPHGIKQRQVHFRNVEAVHPMLSDGNMDCRVLFETLGGQESTWAWHMQMGPDGARTTLISGQVVLQDVHKDAYRREFAKYERRADVSRCRQLLDHEPNADIVRGKESVYSAFRRYVHYTEESFRGVTEVAYRTLEAAGHVSGQRTGDIDDDAGLTDSFCQVAGLALNVIMTHDDNVAFVANSVREWCVSPLYEQLTGEQGWDVWVSFRRTEISYTSDLFVFDACTGTLAEVIIGVRFVEVSWSGFRDFLRGQIDHRHSPQPILEESMSTPVLEPSEWQRDIPKLCSELGAVISKTLDVRQDRIGPDTEFGALGMNSLDAMVVAKDIREVLGLRIRASTLLNCERIADLAAHLVRESSREIVPGIKLHPGPERWSPETLIIKHLGGYEGPCSTPPPGQSIHDRGCVVLTGSTGCLGSHILQRLVETDNIRRVYCLVRPTSVGGSAKLATALKAQLLTLTPQGQAKIHVLETDTAKPLLGLPQPVYETLKRETKHIIHCAWLMAANQPLVAFENQFRTMRNLLDLATARTHHHAGINGKIVFQFVSSIAAVGNYGSRTVPEHEVSIGSVTPMGYAQGKFVCEQMLLRTIGKCRDIFRCHVIRLGQVAGSTDSRLWNTHEHIPMLVKSSQSLGVLPDLTGTLSWYPVNFVATVIQELSFDSEDESPIYHVENPSRSNWKDAIQTLKECLGSRIEVIPYSLWIERVRMATLTAQENPAHLLLDFFERWFVKLSNGGVTMDMRCCKLASPTLRSAKPMAREDISQYMRAWKCAGYLH